MDQLIEVELERYKKFKRFKEEQKAESNQVKYIRPKENTIDIRYQEYCENHPLECYAIYGILAQQFHDVTYCNLNTLSSEELINYRIYEKLKKLYDKIYGNYKENCLSKQLGYVYIQILKELKRVSLEDFEQFKYSYCYIDDEISEYFLRRPTKRHLKVEEELAADRIRVLEYQRLYDICQQEELCIEIKNYYLKLMNIMLNQISSITLRDALLKKVNTVSGSDLDTKIIVFSTQYRKRGNLSSRKSIYL